MDNIQAGKVVKVDEPGAKAKPAAAKVSASASAHPSLAGHIQIARIDHWVKNVFVLPGIVVALSVDPGTRASWSWITFGLGISAVCLIASSNYVINEVLDAPSDQSHPAKRNRPVPSGRVSVPLAYVQWLALMVVGLALGLLVSKPFALTLLVFWIMGCVYNFPPLRSKDVPYLDVLSEAINNPLRMLAGWYLTGCVLVPPASLLLSYWMIGCYFMAIKRLAELRDFAGDSSSASYRKSFGYYTEPRLLVSIMFYGAQAMLFLGAFIMRYRVELILAFPLVALVMSMYLALAFKPNSAAQRPEGLYREPGLMAAVIVCSVAMLLLLFVNLPVIHRIFSPTVPWQNG